MSLKKYSEKRSFDKTPEPGPGGGTPAAGERRVFCVQRHAARALHYDLRLEIDGALKSWAVPHGPTLDPKEKRLAVMVEDHPLAYATFEGNIPQGNYGGGSMMLWDLGTFEPLTGMEPAQQLERGDSKFRLYGQKLKGEFALVRMKTAKANEWLLLKKKDAAATAQWSLDAHALSVKTGRSQGRDCDGHGAAAGGVHRCFRSGGTAQGAARQHAVDNRADAGADWRPDSRERRLAVRDQMGWACGRWHFWMEVRWRVTGRKGTTINAQYPEVVAALETAVQATSAILDGEIAALDEKGRPSFEKLQHRIANSDSNAVALLMKSRPVLYFPFDLLYLNGYDLRDTPLSERKRMLALILQPHNSIRYSQHFDAGGRQLFAAAKAQGLEGILAKRRSSCYASTRSKNWLKFKATNEQDFILCGYTDGKRDFFGALILGCWTEVNGQPVLHYAGTVGTGFDRKLMELIYGKLVPLVVQKPTVVIPASEAKQAVWTRPELVCTVRYLE